MEDFFCGICILEQPEDSGSVWGDNARDFATSWLFAPGWDRLSNRK
jgi:hypothetical protein